MNKCANRSPAAIIQGAEDLGLSFNCLTRRYFWDEDPGLLELALRILGRYGQYFSARTLICSIRDLANPLQPAGHDHLIPDSQKDLFFLVFQELVRRRLSMDLAGVTDITRRKSIIYELARDGEIVDPWHRREHQLFESAGAFAAWVEDHHLDQGEEQIRLASDTLPFDAEFAPDLFLLCMATVEYSLGRHTYMPSACQSFIRNNVHLFTDGHLADIKARVNDFLHAPSRHPTPMDDIDDRGWEAFCAFLENEMLSRSWSRKAAEFMEKSPEEFRESIRHMTGVKAAKTEEDCTRIWYQLDGIHRGIRASTEDFPTRALYLKQLREKKRSIAKRSKKLWWEKNRDRYVQVGPDTYILKKDAAGQA
ncbi:MAG: hypothetical protein IJ083_14280 [Clostridia bacterium]|nr:hypothetical protein [Clostridia bacterium]